MAVQFFDRSALSGAGGLVREEVRAWKMQWSKGGKDAGFSPSPKPEEPLCLVPMTPGLCDRTGKSLSLLTSDSRNASTHSRLWMLK